MRVGVTSMPLPQAVTSGSNPITLKKGIDKTCDFLVGKLKEVARPVKGTEDIRVRRSYTAYPGLNHLLLVLAAARGRTRFCLGHCHLAPSSGAHASSLLCGLLMQQGVVTGPVARL